METTEEYLHGKVRLHVALGKMGGFVFDKKQTRFNEIVNEVQKYVSLGVNADVALFDVLPACIVGDQMHVPNGSVSTIVYDWML